MKGSWFNFIFGLIMASIIIISFHIVKPDILETGIGMVIGILFAIFLQLADLKNK